MADLVGLSAAFVAATLVAAGRPGDSASPGAELVRLLLTLPVCVLAAKLYGLYDADEKRADHSTVDDLVGVLHVVTIGVFAFAAAAQATGRADPDLAQLTTFWGLSVVTVAGARGAARAALRRTDRYGQNTIIVGAGDIGQLVARKLEKHREYGLNVVGFVDSAPKSRRGDLDSLSVLGRPEQLRELVERFEVDRVVVAFSNESAEATRDVIRSINDLDLHIDVVPRLFDIVGPKVGIHTVEGLPLLALPPARPLASARLLKRVLDVAASAAALTLAAPLMGYIAWRVKRDSPGPVFFRQTRLGLHMREFTVLKFRTMNVDTDQEEHRRYIQRLASSGVPTNANGLFKLDRHGTVTPCGRWLRKTSLDELPQLINVLRGEMSLVGPRPCIPYETETFESHHFERFLDPAGMTGLWQVTARANSTFAEALDMDVAYARGWSFGLDIRLLLRTPFQLLRQRRATA